MAFLAATKMSVDVQVILRSQSVVQDYVERAIGDKFGYLRVFASNEEVTISNLDARALLATALAGYHFEQASHLTLAAAS